MKKIFASLCILALGVSTLTGPVSANTKNCKESVFTQNRITPAGSQNRIALAAKTNEEEADEQEPVFHYKILDKLLLSSSQPLFIS